MSRPPHTSPHVEAMQGVHPQVTELWAATSVMLIAVISAIEPDPAERNNVLQRAIDTMLHILADRAPEERSELSSRMIEATVEMFERTLFPTQKG